MRYFKRVNTIRAEPNDAFPFYYIRGIIVTNEEKFLIRMEWNKYSETRMYNEYVIYLETNSIKFFREYGYIHG